MTIWYAGVITLVGAIVIFLITVWVISGSGPAQSPESVTSRLTQVRKRYFLLLSAVLLVMLWLTLPSMPYPGLAPAEPDYIVPVTGKMWSWDIGPLQDRNGKPLPTASDEVVLPLDQALEFQVTTEDVNHGFGIYNQAGRLLIQTQAMPGYVNKLIYTFTEPGIYHVLCMEYCGLAHHNMVTTITIE